MSTADQERFAAVHAVAALTEDPTERQRALAAAMTVIGLFEAGASHAELVAWATDASHAHDVALVERLYGDELFEARLWAHLVRLAAFDPTPAMRAIEVPLLAVFGSADDVTPVDASVASMQAHVDGELLVIAEVQHGNHRLQRPGGSEFVPGYPDVVVDFVLAQTGTRRG